MVMRGLFASGFGGSASWLGGCQPLGLGRCLPLDLGCCTPSRDTHPGQTLPCADPLSWADTSWADTLGTHSSPHPLWTEFLAYAFENITFPQLLLWAIKNLRVEFIICELLEK